MKTTISTILLGALLVGCGDMPKDQPSNTPSKTPAVDGTESAKNSGSEEGAGKSSGKAATSQPSKEQPTSRPTKVSEAKLLDESIYEHRGAGIADAGTEVKLASLSANTADYVGKTVRIRGTVKSVCKKKGCWMKVVDGDREVFVKFVDYAFFMPLDCETREVVLEGKFAFKETSVAALKHYLEDEGKHEEAAKVTEPKLEMSVMAAGVALKK